MAKKNFGIDKLIQSTTTNKNSNRDIFDSDNEPEKTVGLYINIPVSLKKKLDIYCAEQGIKKQNLVIMAIEKLTANK